MADEAQPVDEDARARLLERVLERWRAFPDDLRGALEAELERGLAAAAGAAPETLTVMNPVSRPRRLRLATLAADRALDTMYHREWAELSVSDDGRLYLVYRRRDGGDYAIEWSPATTLPATLQEALSEPLSLALLGGDG